MSKVKVVFDRIYSTATIVINTIWGLIMMFCAIGVLFADYYCVEHMVVPVSVSAGIVILVNVINWFTRKYLREY